jgi:Flp pilus assembly protein TadD
MPYLQEASVGHQIRYARSDHTIPIPRPAFDTRLGIENACQQCHRDRTAQELDAQVTTWYGQLKPHAAPVAGLLVADSLSDPTVAAHTILSSGDSHTMAEIAGLGRVLRRSATPDLTALDGETVDGLERLARGPDRDVQALALATLHLLRGTDPSVRRFLARQLEGMGTEETGVRNRWAWVLRVRGDAFLAAGNHEAALAAYRKAQEVTPGDPVVSRSLGVAYTRVRDYGKAIEHFRQSLALRPNQPQVLVEMGFALMQQGAVDSARQSYREAIALNPWEPAAYANLGLLELRGGMLRPAVSALEKAVQLDPGLANAHFALASAHAQLGERAQAVASVRHGLEFDPNNAAAHRMLDALRGP